MDKVKKITLDEFKNISSKLTFNSILLTKDYYITLILYLIKDVKGIYFKGGTALQKIFLNYSRLSEDIDFTVTSDIEEIKKKIKQILKKSEFFDKVTADKEVRDFTRLVVHYKGFSDEEETVFIDLNKRAKLLLKSEKHKIKHFYFDNIPEFLVTTLSEKELVAEKMTATIARNKPRDHYDLYEVIRSKIPIDLSLVKKKCKQANINFDIIKMFNRAKKLKNKWEQDMIPLLSKEISFQKVIQTLAEHFKLKEEKEKRKN